MGLHGEYRVDSAMAPARSCISVLGYVAVDDEHGCVSSDFLIAFLLQNTQNRDTRALQLKLDELIRSTAGARPQLIQLEELDDDQLDALKHEFERLNERRSRPPAP
jgi:Low affinity iron permease